jgi:hypothetical protein
VVRWLRLVVVREVVGCGFAVAFVGDVVMFVVCR